MKKHNTIIGIVFGLALGFCAGQWVGNFWTDARRTTKDQRAKEETREKKAIESIILSDAGQQQ